MNQRSERCGALDSSPEARSASRRGGGILRSRSDDSDCHTPWRVDSSLPARVARTARGKAPVFDTMNESHPKLAERSQYTEADDHWAKRKKVLQQLLREQVSIRDLGVILEALVEVAQHSKSTVHQVEMVRQTLGRALVHPLLDTDGGLRVLVLAPDLEREIIGTFDPDSAPRLLGDGTKPAPAAFLRMIVDSVKRLTGDASIQRTFIR